MPADRSTILLLDRTRQLLGQSRYAEAAQCLDKILSSSEDFFFKAEAEIAGGDTVVVWSPRVPSPKAVRFGWHQLAVPNLANKEGLPASPFRTDKW